MNKGHNRFRIDGDVAYIMLQNGMETAIDKEDLESSRRVHWFAGYYKRGDCWRVCGKDENGKHVYLSRRLMNAPSSHMVDHINRNTLDNRKGNLRICTCSQNNGNRIKFGGSSIYKGVSFSKEKNMWVSHITTGDRGKFLGYFRSEEDAARAYNNAAIEQWGEFARINDIKASEDVSEQ